jgi:hypothetical protein
MITTRIPDRIKDRTVMGEYRFGMSDESYQCNEDDVHTLHVSNELKFARLFMDVARAAYGGGNIEAGNVALARARAAYVGAIRIADELPENKRQSIWDDLNRLKGALAVLSMAKR